MRRSVYICDIYAFHEVMPKKIQIIPAPKKLSLKLLKNARVTTCIIETLMLGILHWMYFYVFYFFWFFAYLRFNDIGKVDHLHFCNFFSYHDFFLICTFYYFITLFQTSIFVQKLHFKSEKKLLTQLAFRNVKKWRILDFSKFLNFSIFLNSSKFLKFSKFLNFLNFSKFL